MIEDGRERGDVGGNARTHKKHPHRAGSWVEPSMIEWTYRLRRRPWRVVWCDGWVSSGLRRPSLLACVRWCGCCIRQEERHRRRTSRQRHGYDVDKKIKKETLEAVPRS